MSGYKSMLTVFRSPDDAAAVCRLATGIATNWDSHLVGFHARPGLAINTGLRGPELDRWLDDKRRAIEHCNALIRAAVEQSAVSSGRQWDWREMTMPAEPAGDTAVALARCCDLVVIDRLKRQASLIDPDMTLEQLIFESGRPVLMVPTGCRSSQLGQRIVVAWNGTCEACRAVYDALPLLAHEGVEEIRLVCPPAPDHGPRHLPPGVDLAAALARHGIDLEVAALPGRHANAGPEIMAQCEEFGADLLVMGGYGHSRLREYVFGGTTETIMNESQIPVLISR